MDTKVKQIIEGKTKNSLPEVARIPNILNNYLLGNKDKKLSIHALRIILVILTSIKDKQLRDDYQLSLFDKDWFDTDKKTTYTTQFNFYLKDFLSNNSKNYDYVREGLKSLALYNIEQKFIGEKGNKITVVGGLISNLIYNEGKKGVKFEMNAYWYKVFVDLSKNYNKFLSSIIFNISSSNALLFYLFLKTLKEGTTMKMDTLNEKFQSNYINWSKIKQKILDPIRNELNKNADISFNYEIKDNKANIVVYDTINAVPALQKEDNYLIKKAVHYKKVKYDLSGIELGILESLYKKYGYDFVYKVTSRKKDLVKLRGREYVDKFHSYIRDNVKSSMK